jgi:hypothetical protein
MSEAVPLPTPSAAPDPPHSPIVRLKTWVNVVLVLILLASCSGASNVSDIVSQTSGSSLASQDEVTDMCRLLGAVATKQGVDLDTVFAGSPTTQCQDAARGNPTP